MVKCTFVFFLLEDGRQRTAKLYDHQLTTDKYVTLQHFINKKDPFKVQDHI